MARPVVDPKTPDSQVRITDFGGMSPGTDQHANNPGLSWFQTNVVSLFPGELRARRGYQVVRFDQPVRTSDLLVTASSTYVAAPAASAWLQSELRVFASSEYVVASDASTGGGFVLLGLL